MSRRNRNPPVLDQPSPASSTASGGSPQKPPAWSADPNPKKPIEVFAAHGLQCLEAHRLPYFFRWLVEQIRDGDPTGPQQLAEVGNVLVSHHRTYRRTVNSLIKLSLCRLRIRQAAALARTRELTELERQEREIGQEVRDMMDSDNLEASHLPDNLDDVPASGDAMDHLEASIDFDSLPAR